VRPGRCRSFFLVATAAGADSAVAVALSVG
jgi:hypothetical protein